MSVLTPQEEIKALRLENDALRSVVAAFKVRIAFLPNLPPEEKHFAAEVEMADLAVKIANRDPAKIGPGIFQIARNAALAALSIRAVEDRKHTNIAVYCSEAARRAMKGEFICGPEPS